MRKIPDKGQGSVLEFSLDLARDSENLPKKVLSLFDQHFGYRRSIFFTHGIPSPGASRRKGAMNSYITYGIRYGPM